MTDVELIQRLRTYFDPGDTEEDHDLIRSLMVAAANRLERLGHVYDAAKIWRASKWRENWFLTKREQALRDAIDSVEVP